MKFFGYLSMALFFIFTLIGFGVLLKDSKGMSEPCTVRDAVRIAVIIGALVVNMARLFFVAQP